jgi:hypothetical protein
MNQDQQTILAAYSDTLKELYATLFNQYVQAGGDAAQEDQASQHFLTGLGLARRARDKAVALVA